MQSKIISADLGMLVLDELRRVQTLQEGGMLVAAFINAVPGGVAMVFGPVKNGGIIRDGHPDHRANLRVIEHTITRLREEDGGQQVVNQLVFKPFVDKHRLIWLGKHQRTPGAYYEPLIHDFYEPILDTGKIEVGYFIHGWKHSRVPKFAHRLLEKQQKKIVELPKGFHEQHKQLAA